MKLEFSPPRQVTIPVEDQDALRDQAMAIIDDTLDQFDQFVRDGRALSPQYYQPVKARPGLQLFQERPEATIHFDKSRMYNPSTPKLLSMDEKDGACLSNSSGKTRHDLGLTSSSTGKSSTAASNTGSSQGGKTIRIAEKSKNPVLIGTWAADGSLEDYMFGTMLDDPSASNFSNGTADARCDLQRVVGCIDDPTIDEPFHFLGIRWILFESKGIQMRNQTQDTAILHGTGIVQDKEGRRVGYDMYQSVLHSSIPDYSRYGVERIKVWYISLVREEPGGGLEFFTTAVTHPDSTHAKRGKVPLAVQRLLSVVDTFDTSLVRKLQWLAMKSRFDPNMQRKRRATTSDGSGTCRMCAKKANKWGPFSSSTSICHICCEVVCQKCCVTKKVCVDATEDECVKSTWEFCIGCVMRAKGRCGKTIAAEAMHESSLSTASVRPSTFSPSGSQGSNAFHW